MTVEELFNRSAARYDLARRQLVPCFDDFYGAALDRLPADRDVPLRVLDLGAGTGLLAALVAGAYPSAHLTLVDLSAAMLRRAEERFAAQPGRVALRRLDFLREDLGGPYDAVVSALAIHHLADEEKRVLYGKVYEALRPGGVFVNAEQVLGPTPEVEAEYHRIWLREARARGVTEEDLAMSLERMRADRCAPVEPQLVWLREAGFVEVDCWYKWYRFAVMGGVRAGAQR